MKKIFVTGGGGFIGSHLVEKLVKLGFKVKTLVPYNIENSWGWIDNFEDDLKNNVEVITGDICDPNLLLKETKGIDVIFHLAALIKFFIIFINHHRAISQRMLLVQLIF